MWLNCPTRSFAKSDSFEIEPWLPGYSLSRTYEAQTTDFRISRKWPPNGIYSGMLSMASEHKS